MAKTRWTGRGAVVGTYSTSNSSFTPAGLTRSITPPPAERSIIDVTGMEDTTAVADGGIEQLSVFTFQALHATTDTVDSNIKTWYGSQLEKNWYIRCNNGDKLFTTKFKGKVTAYRPQTFTGNDPVTWEVQVHRTGAITYSVTS
jgi:hypothetical protein